MSRLFTIVTMGTGLWLFSQVAAPTDNALIDLSGFQDVDKHWNDKYGRDRHDERYRPDQSVAIADNILTYQNDDGGWPKSFNPLVKVPEAELRALLGRSLTRSTCDNRTTYTQIAFLAQVFAVTGEARFQASAERGLDYICESNGRQADGGAPMWMP